MGQKVKSTKSTPLVHGTVQPTDGQSLLQFGAGGELCLSKPSANVSQWGILAQACSPLLHFSGENTLLFPKPRVHNARSCNCWTGRCKESHWVSTAAIELALQTPSLLSSRQILLEVARKKVNNDGYVYKKGESIEAMFSTSRVCLKTSEAFRMKRIQDLEDDIKDLNDRLMFKEKRRDQASNVRNYKVCDMVMEELSVIKQQKREREVELRTLQRKQRKSSWYKQKKTRSKLSQFVSEYYRGEPSDSSILAPSSPTSPCLSSSPSPSTPVSSVATTSVNLPSAHSPRKDSLSHCSSHPGSPNV